MKHLFWVAVLTALVSCSRGGTGGQGDDAGVAAEGEDEVPCVIESERDPDTYCTQQYEPVCGCNNKTYGNACMARIDGVQRWTDGRCGEPVPEV